MQIKVPLSGEQEKCRRKAEDSKKEEHLMLERWEGLSEVFHKLVDEPLEKKRALRFYQNSFQATLLKSWSKLQNLFSLWVRPK